MEEKNARDIEAEKNPPTNNQIHVKPIIQTVKTSTSPASSPLVKMNNDDKIDDLLR